jgi:hypothetical protein
MNAVRNTAEDDNGAREERGTGCSPCLGIDMSGTFTDYVPLTI